MTFTNPCYTQLVATKRDRVGDNLAIALRRVREAREAAELTQSELGGELGMSRGGYGLLESGSRIMTLEDLFQIARILNRPVEYFLGLDMALLPELVDMNRRLQEFTPERRQAALRSMADVLRVFEQLPRQ